MSRKEFRALIEAVRELAAIVQDGAQTDGRTRLAGVRQRLHALAYNIDHRPAPCGVVDGEIVRLGDDRESAA